MEVNSFHHQAVQRLGKGLRATAWAQDGTIEAIENPSDRLVLGVQWHAEGLRDHGPLFELLVAAAAGVGASEPRVVGQRAGESRRLTATRRSPRSRRPAGAQLAEAG